MSKATDDVLAERQRQIEAEGWTEEHDDQHADGSMALAACCYASMAAAYAEVCTGGWSPEQIDYVRLRPGYNWPRSWSRAWWKPKNPRRDLVRAAALLIAEIERLDRRAPEETISIGQMFAEVMKTEAAQERFFPFEFEVWQGDNMVASASGPRDDALREAMNYAAQYEQDGPARVFEVTRTLATPNVELRGGPAVSSPERPA